MASQAPNPAVKTFLAILVATLLWSGGIPLDAEAAPPAPPAEGEATRVIEAAKPALLHLKVVGMESEVDAASGSGFAIDAQGRVATNYHVVSDIVLKPEVYRLRYKATDGKAGFARVVAIDIANDLAILQTDYRVSNPLRLSKSAPVRGQAVYSLGFPNRQSETVTQGLYNGPVERRYAPRFHFTGPINAGMSGGPALDARGEVFGVNVESASRQQLASYLVPAKALGKLIERAQQNSAAVGVREVERQIAEAGDELVQRLLAEKAAPVRFGDYLVPGETGLLKCSTLNDLDPSGDFELLTQRCTPRAEIWVSSETDEAIGMVLFMSMARNLKYSAVEFSAAAGLGATGEWSKPKVERGAFACRYKTVALRGLRARAEICASKYRKFDLADYTVHLATVDRSDVHLSVSLRLNTLREESARRLIKSILESVAWAPATS